jgi:hypothetical protein
MGPTVALGKTVPEHTYGSAGGDRMSSYSFTTSALDGDEWSGSRPGRPLPPGKDPRYPLDRRLGGSQSQSGHKGYRKNSLSLQGLEP